uniref:Uncharacterized protein n=1 Tax=Latimeria chalumnae TaxID=7897 RepID=H3A0M8_LATCH
MSVLNWAICAVVVLAAWCLVCEAGTTQSEQDWEVQEVALECPRTCSCPEAGGCRLVADGCGCGCKVCARQFNEMCSRLEPCDRSRGLRCVLGPGPGPGPGVRTGICRASMEGRSCFLNGTAYQHGETFQPACDVRCSCTDGTVGCVPACPLQAPLLHCHNPQLVKVAGKCCKEWRCEDGESNAIGALLVPQGHGRLEPRKKGKERKNNAIESNRGGKANGRKDRKPHRFGKRRCPAWNTEWSGCSKTCGSGISTRIITNSRTCRPKTERRLCQVRPCAMAPNSTAGKRRCSEAIRAEEPLRLLHKSCTSARRYRPRFCGSCGEGRPCFPSLSKTREVRFQCQGGLVVSKQVMWIQRCSCPGRHE